MLPAAKLIFVNRYYRPDQSATSQMLTDLTCGLAARSFTVHVICSRQLYDDPKARLPRSECMGGVVVHRIATTRFGRRSLVGRAFDYASFYASCAVVLMRLARRGDVLIPKTDPPLISLVAALVARLKGAGLVNWQQDVFPEVASELGANPLPAWLDHRLRLVRDAALKSARMNVLLGNRMLEFFVARGVPRSKLCVIENWADAETIRPTAIAASQLRAGLALSGQFVVCYSGNLGRAHDHETLASAAVALRDDGSVTFLFIGGGVHMDTLKFLAAEQHLNRVLFLPYQPRRTLADSLACGDVHVVTLNPHLEGLIVPSKFYGILAAGRPVIFIGDPDGELAGIIRESRCGLVVAAGQPIALVAAIQRLQGDAALRVAMGLAARQLFSAKYTVAHAVVRWAQVLERL